MIKIRLSRVGTKNQPKYRIVAIDEQNKREGKFLEILGHYNPTIKPIEVRLNKERLAYWVGVGAKTTEAVEKLTKESN
jgi:small subunit ribosomal protein S16